MQPTNDSTITLVTGNANKLRELQAIAPAGLKFANQQVDLPEIQSLDLRAIVEDKARRAYQVVGGPVIVEDVSAELDCLQGLPGPFIKFFHERLGNDALFRLSDNTNNRLTIRCNAAYYDGQRLLIGEGIVTGKAVEPRGSNGFGFDGVFMPDRQDDTPADGQRTVGEMSEDEKNAISHRALAMRNLLQQL